jgi:hypothetical protein
MESLASHGIIVGEEGELPAALNGLQQAETDFFQSAEDWVNDRSKRNKMQFLEVARFYCNAMNTALETTVSWEAERSDSKTLAAAAANVVYQSAIDRRVKYASLVPEMQFTEILQSPDSLSGHFNNLLNSNKIDNTGKQIYWGFSVAFFRDTELFSKAVMPAQKHQRLSKIGEKTLQSASHLYDKFACRWMAKRLLG